MTLKKHTCSLFGPSTTPVSRRDVLSYSMGVGASLLLGPGLTKANESLAPAIVESSADAEHDSEKLQTVLSNLSLIHI